MYCNLFNSTGHASQTVVILQGLAEEMSMPCLVEYGEPFFTFYYGLVITGLLCYC